VSAALESTKVENPCSHLSGADIAVKEDKHVEEAIVIGL
jgi:hypothetical protein